MRSDRRENSTQERIRSDCDRWESWIGVDDVRQRAGEKPDRCCSYDEEDGDDGENRSENENLALLPLFSFWEIRLTDSDRRAKRR